MVFEYYGNVHMHTTYSDGTGTFDELIEAANTAGLDFVYVTDHNVLVRDSEEGYRQGVLTLVGQEVHDREREPQRSHLLCLGVEQDVTPHAKDPQRLIDAVNDQDGLAVLAHPVEHSTRLLPEQFSWADWDVTGYTGLEVWNYMSSFRKFTVSKKRTLLVAYFPDHFLVGPGQDVLQKWDELTQTRAVVGIGGTDVHAFRHRAGLLNRCFLPYLSCARALNTHILSETPFLGAGHDQYLNGDAVAHDREILLSSLRLGHCWIGYDRIGATQGFRFAAWQLPADAELDPTTKPHAIMGDTLEKPGAGRATSFVVHAPANAQIRLLRNGKPAASSTGRELRYATSDAGVYRVEVWRKWRSRLRAWILSNPIYVR